MATEVAEQWREPTPKRIDDEGSSSNGSTSYESEELIPRPQKRPHGEEDDSVFDLKGDTRGSRAEPRVPPKHGNETLRHEVLT